MKFKLKVINKSIRTALEDYAANPIIIEKLMNGEALVALEVDIHAIKFHEDAGWIQKSYLIQVIDPIDVVKSESKVV